MVALRRKFSNRGASILPALVFVALLAGVATTIQYLSPTGSERGAQIATTAPASTATKDEVKRECKAGEVNEVSIQNGKVTPLPAVKANKCWNVDVKPQPQRLSSTGLCQDFDNPNDCRVVACVTKDNKQVCEVVGEFDSTNPTATGAFDKVMKSGDPKDVFNAMKDNGNLDGLTTLAGNMDSQTQKALNDAFSAPIKDAQDATQAQIQQNQTASKELDAMIDLCAQSFDPSSACGKSGDKSLAELQAEKDKLAAETALLQKQMKDLSAAQTALKPPFQGPCPDGQPVNPSTGACSSSAPPCPTCGGTPDSTGFGKSNPPSSFMNNLGKSLTGGSSAPRPAAPPPQACSTNPDAYSQQQQQYQAALQQYNYQLQLYNQQQQQASLYGMPAPIPPVAPAPCTPSTGNQCQSQPPQPNPANCTTGPWQPTYSGACITSWSCPSAPNAPTATLSCEPKVADVGMTLAITYGCSSGTATSTSFAVTTQPGGSATTTVANPPSGTNTATYTLSCTDQGKTTGAQCSVQVNKPSIILVANPKTVLSGETSLLSWLTTGMQSCIISSPDQADFTTRNSSNTSVNGAAESSVITASTRFLLHCETLAGGVRDATTTIGISN